MCVVCGTVLHECLYCVVFASLAGCCLKCVAYVHVARALYDVPGVYTVYVCRYGD